MNENSIPILAYGLVTLTSMMLAYVTVLDKSEPEQTNEENEVPEIINEEPEEEINEEQQQDN